MNCVVRTTLGMYECVVLYVNRNAIFKAEAVEWSYQLLDVPHAWRLNLDPSPRYAPNAGCVFLTVHRPVSYWEFLDRVPKRDDQCSTIWSCRVPTAVCRLLSTGEALCCDKSDIVQIGYQRVPLWPYPRSSIKTEYFPTCVKTMQFSSKKFRSLNSSYAKRRAGRFLHRRNGLHRAVLSHLLPTLPFDLFHRTNPHRLRYFSTDIATLISKGANAFPQVLIVSTSTRTMKVASARWIAFPK